MPDRRRRVARLFCCTRPSGQDQRRDAEHDPTGDQGQHGPGDVTRRHRVVSPRRSCAGRRAAGRAHAGAPAVGAPSMGRRTGSPARLPLALRRAPCSRPARASSPTRLPVVAGARSSTWAVAQAHRTASVGDDRGGRGGRGERHRRIGDRTCRRPGLDRNVHLPVEALLEQRRRLGRTRPRSPGRRRPSPPARARAQYRLPRWASGPAVELRRAAISSVSVQCRAARSGRSTA